MQNRCMARGRRSVFRSFRWAPSARSPTTRLHVEQRPRRVACSGPILCRCSLASRVLGLAAACSTAVGCSAGRSTCSSTVGQTSGRAGDGETPASLTDRRDGLVLHLDQGAGGPAATLGNRLLVRSEVEADEEEEVRGDDDHSRNGGKLLTSALAQVGELGEVSAGEVGPRSEVDEA